ncbi:PAS domain S-box protein [bacterium]|nr:PAS domain S-box protein [bacterium]
MEINLFNILELLHLNTGYDFRNYKKSTINRRIKKEMKRVKVSTFNQYYKYLQDNPDYLNSLFKLLLVHVTQFFRDSEAFDIIENKVIPQVAKIEKPIIRIWIAGVSSGEEAYSIAILLKKFIPNKKITIFATDIDEISIKKARDGVYTITNRDIIEKIEPYFEKIGENRYKASQQLRDMIVFSTHSLIKDTPFSKMDFISCRNLLIYFQEEIQTKVIKIFHYALNSDGYLFLGNAESIGKYDYLFREIDKKWRIYQKLPVKTVVDAQMFFFDRKTSEKIGNTQDKRVKMNNELKSLIEKKIISYIKPTAAVISKNGELLFSCGEINKYLEIPSGEHSSNIFNMAKEGMKIPIASAVRRSFQLKERVFYKEIFEGKVTIIAEPFDHEPYDELIIVIFEETNFSYKTVQQLKESINPDSDDEYVKKLEEDLKSTREYLESAIEELNALNEELRTSNEELQSANEEQQSVNEELETSKEELQSINEELLSVNLELQLKNEELVFSKDLYQITIQSLKEGIVVINKDYSIELVNNSFRHMFRNIIKGGDILGKSLFNIFPDSREEYETLFNTGKESFKEEIYSLSNNKYISKTLFNPDSSIIDSNIYFNEKIVTHTFRIPIWEKDSIIKIITIIRDVTEEKRYEKELIESRRILDTLMNNIPGIVYKCIKRDSGLYFDVISKRVVEFTGYSFDYFDKKNITTFVSLIHPDDREEIYQYLKKLNEVKETKEFSFSFRIINLNGRIYWILNQGKIVTENGEISVVEGVLTNITEQKNIEIQLENNKVELESIIEDRTQKILMMNDELKLYNEELKDMNSRLMDEVIIRQNAEAELNQYKDSLEEIIFKRTMELANSESKYRVLFESTNDAILLLEDSIFVECNQKTSEIFGYPKSEIIGKTPYYFSPTFQEDGSLSLDKAKKYILAAYMGDTQSFEWQHLKKDRTIVDCEIVLFPVEIKDKTFLQVIIRDITDKKRATKEIEKKDLQIKQIISSVDINIWSVDNKGEFVFSEGKGFKIMGITQSEVFGKSIFDVYQNYPLIISQIQRGLQGERFVDYASINHLVFQVYYEPIFDNLNRVIGLSGICVDVTKLKTIEKRIQEREQAYHLLFTQMSSAFGVLEYNSIKDEFVFLEANSIMLDHFEIDDGEIKGKKFKNTCKAFEHTCLPHYKDVLNSGVPKKFEHHCPYYDKYFHIVAYRPQPGRVAFLQDDITSRKKSEEELQKQQKIESIGILAGGIAHDFNNILAAILGNVSFLRIDGDWGKEHTSILHEIEKATLQAKELTHQLLTFAKGGDPIKEVADIESLIKDTSLFVLRGSKLSCKFRFSENFPAVEVDKAQLSQVVQNLVINAMQAMPEGGKIEIIGEIKSLEKDNEYHIKSGNYISVKIKDYGMGIPEKYLTKIFDPYFTTKQSGNGLGLAICYSIIKKHNGTIVVFSKLGEGSIFEFILPITDKKLLLEEEKVVFNNIANKGKILVMEDEAPLIRLIVKILTKFGYEAKAVTTGEEMLVEYEKEFEKGVPYNLVIMDLTIQGGMGGEEAIKRLLAIYPDAKAIVSSGYSNDPVMSNYKEYGFKKAIHKPFLTDIFIKSIQDVLK